MDLIDIFFLGLFFENIFVWYAVGLSVVVLFSYSMEEALWVSLRFFLFIVINAAIIIFLRPVFSSPVQELFLLALLIAIETVLSVLMDILLPQSHLEDTVSGFIRRGDAILPLVFAVIISKKFDAMETVFYSFGVGLGFGMILCMITAISIVFNFHRLHPRHTYVLKLCILGVLSMISY